MEKDIYGMVNPETKQKKVKAPRKPINKDTLVILIVALVIILLTAGIVIYYFWGANSEVLVTYKDGKITRGEYEAVYRYWAPQLAYYGYDAETISGIVVDEILLNKVMYVKATEAGFKITDEDTKTIEENFANEDSIKALRASSINPDVLRDFFEKNAVVSDYLESLEDSATTDSVKEAILKEEGEKADLNIYNTRHILISVATDATAEQKKEAKTKAENLLKQVKAGKDFATLAKNNSDDSGTASDGGQFKMVNVEGTIDDAYRKAVLSLKAGTVYSKLVESDFGYFIIRLESIEKNGRLTNESDVQTTVNVLVQDEIEKVFVKDEHKKELEKVTALANKFNMELGIAQTTSEE